MNYALRRLSSFMGKMSPQQLAHAQMRLLPVGDKILAEGQFTSPSGANRRMVTRPIFRVVDRRIWGGLDAAARGRYIETVRREIGA
jgi:hypothetical protein